MNSDSTSPQFVPKVHPLHRDCGPEDPFELVASTAVGDPDVMIECILQEFLWMGWSEPQLLALFHDPGYPMLSELRAFYGDAEIRRRVANMVSRTGQLQFREVLAEPDETAEIELNLVQLTASPCAAGPRSSQPGTPAGPQ